MKSTGVRKFKNGLPLRAPISECKGLTDRRPDSQAISSAVQKRAVNPLVRLKRRRTG